MLAFGEQQVLSCLFPGVLFLTFALTRVVSVPGLPRYDLVLLVCLLAQAAMVGLRLETKDELKVIGVFHLAGLGLELFKTHAGCWAYPEAGGTKLWGVPLYSGFMYASVASYLCQAWRRLCVTLHDWPATRATWLLVVAIYVNFFTERWLGDARWVLAALIV